MERKPQGLPQDMFDLYYRSSLKAFTPVLNYHICLSPPLANTKGQGMFHLFIELKAGANYPKLFFVLFNGQE